MPAEPEEEAEELDEELESLKAELEKERAKHGMKKPEEKKPTAAPPAPIQQPTQPREEDRELKAELEGERVSVPAGKPSPPQAGKPPTPYAAPSKPAVYDEEDDSFRELKAELEREKARHAIPPKEPQPQAEAAGGEATQPPAKPAVVEETPKPPVPIPPVEEAKKPEPKFEFTPPKEKKVAKPTLELLKSGEGEFEDYTPPAPRPSPQGKQPLPLKLMVTLILLAVLAAAAIVVLPMLTKQEVKYQCWDTSWVDDPFKCPTPTTTTTPPTTTTETLPPLTLPTTTTTIAPETACYDNKMCERKVPYFPFCDGAYVKTPDVKYSCIHPGTPQSYCKATATVPKLVKMCEQWEYCWGGECYPEHCRNKKRDWAEGELKVDCGGKCRACNSTDTLCKVNEDCGKDACGTPYCNSANNPTMNCTRNVCVNPGQPNSDCTVKKTVEVLEICSRTMVCRPGQDDCVEGRPGEGTCHDCMQNQGETDIDCGGPCQPCAYMPYSYDTLNLTAADTYDYGFYKLKLEKTLRERNCSIGANIWATDPYGKSESRQVTRFENARFYDIRFGMISVDASTIRIWLTMDTPT